eukprot:s989_g4.t1
MDPDSKTKGKGPCYVTSASPCPRDSAHGAGSRHHDTVAPYWKQRLRAGWVDQPRFFDAKERVMLKLVYRALQNAADGKIVSSWKRNITCKIPAC